MVSYSQLLNRAIRRAKRYDPVRQAEIARAEAHNARVLRRRARQAERNAMEAEDRLSHRMNRGKYTSKLYAKGHMNWSGNLKYY